MDKYTYKDMATQLLYPDLRERLPDHVVRVNTLARVLKALDVPKSEVKTYREE